MYCTVHPRLANPPSFLPSFSGRRLRCAVLCGAVRVGRLKCSKTQMLYLFIITYLQANFSKQASKQTNNPENSLSYSPAQCNAIQYCNYYYYYYYHYLSQIKLYYKNPQSSAPPPKHKKKKKPHPRKSRQKKAEKINLITLLTPSRNPHRTAIYYTINIIPPR